MRAKAYIVHRAMCEPALEWSKPKDCLSAEPLYAKREWQGLTDDEMQKIIKLVAQKCAEIADTAEPYQSADLIRKHFGVEK